LLPESQSFAAALKEVGIAYELHEIDEMPHAFMMLSDFSACGEGRRLMFNFSRSARLTASMTGANPTKRDVIGFP